MDDLHEPLPNFWLILNTHADENFEKGVGKILKMIYTKGEVIYLDLFKKCNLTCQNRISLLKHAVKLYKKDPTT